jgi:uncharacterized membrane protein YgdD (TMEM256/DUF423 family)
MAKIWIILAAMLGAGGVAMGAYHAHSLEKWLLQRGLEAESLTRQMHNCEVAARYQMHHALALLAVGILALGHRGGLLHCTAGLFLMGIVLFSGGLYLIVFTGKLIHWAIVPSGGLLLMTAWLSLALVAVRISLRP